MFPVYAIVFVVKPSYRTEEETIYANKFLVGKLKKCRSVCRCWDKFEGNINVDLRIKSNVRLREDGYDP
jgi:hypothetical protein